MSEEEYNGYFADCYVLTSNRSQKFVQKFLDDIIPERQEKADEYEVPQYSEKPVEKFNSYLELTKYLEENPDVEYSIYFSNLEKSNFRGVELFYTNDSHLILGGYTETKYPKTEIEEEIFKNIKRICGSDEGYITYEELPPMNSNEFRSRIKSNRV